MADVTPILAVSVAVGVFPASPGLLLQVPGTPELIVILLILLLLFVPTMLLLGGGAAGYLLFFEDDEDEGVAVDVAEEGLVGEADDREREDA